MSGLFRLLILVKDLCSLGAFIRGAAGVTDGPGRRVSGTVVTRRGPSLRPPTMMVDLLAASIMLFAFQMGDPSGRSVAALNVELPSTEAAANRERAEILPLRPERADGVWLYRLPDGRRLKAPEVAALVKGSRKVAVLVVAKSDTVQSYVDAEQPLRRAGMSPALAIEEKGDGQ